MQKIILNLIISLIILGIIFSPFMMPDNMIYIKKGSKSIYIPFAYNLIKTSLIVCSILIGAGINSVVSQINEILKK